MAGAPERTAGAAEKSKTIIARTASNVRDVVWAIDARRDRASDLLHRMEDTLHHMQSDLRRLTTPHYDHHGHGHGHHGVKVYPANNGIIVGGKGFQFKIGF